MSAIRTVAVTGAAGTVGGFVVDALLEKGYRLIAIDRPGTPLPEETERVEVRAGDLTSKEFCRECLAGADAVIHTAAVIDIGWTYEQLKPINVTAVSDLYEAARAERSLVFVHFSSGSIYDHSSGMITETTPVHAESPYEQSKIDSEHVLEGFHGRGGPAYVVIRPSLIYGPRGRLLGAALAAVPPILRLFTGDSVFSFVGGPRLNWVHGEDVARAAVFCMENENCWGEVFNVADDTPLPIGDVLNAVSRSYGLEPGRTVPMPPKWISRLFYRFIDTDPFFQVINTAVSPLWTMVRSRYDLEDELQVKVDRASASYFVRDVVFSNEKIRKAGYDFTWPDVRSGYPAVLSWYQEHGWAPRLELGRGEDVPDTWGFEFRQVLRGSWNSPDRGVRSGRVELAIAARAESVGRFARENKLAITGTVNIEGLAKDAEAVGTLETAILAKGKFIYELELVGDDGKTYYFRGVEDVEPANILQTMTTMEIAVRDGEGRTIGTGAARFDLSNDLLSMAASFRPIY